MPDLSNLDITSIYCDDGTTMRTWSSYRIGNSSTNLNTTDQHNYLLRIKFTLSQSISSLSFNLGPCYWYPYDKDNSRKLTYSGNTVYHTSSGGTKYTLYQPGSSQNCFGYAITTSDTALGYISGLNSGDSNPTTAINNALSAAAAGTKARGDIVITAAANESSRWANLTGACDVSLPAGTYYLWCFATNYDMDIIFRFFCASGFYYNKTPTISVINESYLGEPAAIMYTKVNNQWVSGLPYIKINNAWKQAVATYIKVNGQWKLNK